MTWFKDLGKPLEEGLSEYFYKAGISSHNGTSKFHLFKDCSLLFGRPDRVDGSGVYRTTYPSNFVDDRSICKRCLKKAQKSS